MASSEILARVLGRVRAAGFAIGNVDATVVAQAPWLAPHLGAMARFVAGVLEVAVERVNVKVTSSDGLGFTGRGEGIAALAIALLEPNPAEVAP
jgi:2-C-methyl-D-erythritol 2,4-cyclodiphosphate synthase